jgi:uncharacterized protein YbjT (DUF2867 family)
MPKPSEAGNMQRRSFVLTLLVLPLLGRRSLAAAPDSALVFGANGQLGAAVVRLLLARNISVTAFVRPGSDRSLLAGLEVTYVEGDARNRDDVQRAMGARYDVVVNAIARRDRAETGLYDITQNNITAVARTTGVRQLVFYSSVGVGSSRSIYSDADYERFRSTMEERERAEQELIASGVPYTIIRIGRVLADGAGTGAGYLSPEPALGGLTRAELARIGVSCIGDSACLNKIYHAVPKAG